MAGGFAINSNGPLFQRECEVVKDLAWFKQQLERVGVSTWHIHMNAQEEFNNVAPHLFEWYVSFRKNWTHREALQKAKEVYEKEYL